MKKISLSLVVFVAVVFCFFAFTIAVPSGIRGKISPLNGADTVLAILGKDTLVTNVVNGKFAFSNIKKATYVVVISANPPYKNTTIRDVAVIDSAITDVGEVKLRR